LLVSPLGRERKLAYRVLTGMDKRQRDHAAVATEAPTEIEYGSGGLCKPNLGNVGVSIQDLTSPSQVSILELLSSYLGRLCAPLEDAARSHFDQQYFAFLGAAEPLREKNFTIEFILANHC